jgi:hypothetical protein
MFKKMFTFKVAVAGGGRRMGRVKRHQKVRPSCFTFQKTSHDGVSVPQKDIVQI